MLNTTETTAPAVVTPVPTRQGRHKGRYIPSGPDAGRTCTSRLHEGERFLPFEQYYLWATGPSSKCRRCLCAEAQARYHAASH